MPHPIYFDPELSEQQIAADEEFATQVFKLMTNSYSPYSIKVIQAGCPISLRNQDMSEGGATLRDLWTGKPTKIWLNRNFRSLYSFNKTMEHEAFHWEQHSNDDFIQYYPWYFALPQHSYKIVALAELHTCGKEAYKLVKDYAADLITPYDVQLDILESRGMLTDFVGAYVGKPIDHNQVVRELDKIKQSGVVKDCAEIMPEFLYKVSTSKINKDTEINKHIDYHKNYIEIMASQAPEQARFLFRLMKEEADLIGNVFAASDIDKVVGWDGSEPMRRLAPQKQKELLVNISSLDNDQRRTVEFTKKMVNELTA